MALTNNIDEVYPDWLAWSLVIGLAFAIAGIGGFIGAAIIESATLALAAASSGLLGSVAIYAVLNLAEKYHRNAQA